MAKGEKNRKAEHALHRAIRERLAARNQTLVTLAGNMDVPVERLRQWIKRGRFPGPDLLRLAAQLGLPADLVQLKHEYGVETTTHGRLKPAKPLDVAETIQSILAPRIHEPKEDGFGADVIRFLGSMEVGETILVWSINQVAFEWTNVGWRTVGNALAWAISERGIFCCYCHPSERELSRLRSDCGLRNLPHEDFFENAFGHFRRNLLAVDEIRDINTGTVLMKDGQKKRLNEQLVLDHVARVAVDSAAFCAPDHRYALFVPANPGGKAPSALARFPTGARKKPLLLPLNEEATFNLYDFLLTAPKEIAEEDRNRPIVKLVTSLATKVITKASPSNNLRKYGETHAASRNA